MEPHPQTLRALILTARAPHQALGVPPSATRGEVVRAADRMRSAVCALGVADPLIIDTIARAEARMLATAPVRPIGGQRNRLNCGPLFGPGL